MSAVGDRRLYRSKQTAVVRQAVVRRKLYRTAHSDGEVGMEMAIDDREMDGTRRCGGRAAVREQHREEPHPRHPSSRSADDRVLLQQSPVPISCLAVALAHCTNSARRGRRL